MQKFQEEVKKYQDALVGVNNRLNELETQRSHLLKQGLKLEGIVSYLQGKIQDAQIPPVQPPERAA